MKPHIFRDGEGVMHDSCIMCQQPQRIAFVGSGPSSIELAALATCPGPRKPPYPFCSHAEKCIAAGRCARTVRGERWSCAD